MYFFFFAFFDTPAESIRQAEAGISGKAAGLERPWARDLDAVEVGYPVDMRKQGPGRMKAALQMKP